MSRLFVTDQPVAVWEFDPAEVISETPPSVVYIRARMDYATDAKVKSELFTLGKDSATVEARLGENTLALLKHNIVRWEGPLFVDDAGRPISCTPENIGKIDPQDPFIARVAEEIARRNARKAGPSPKSATASTSESAGVPASNQNNESISVQLATGTSRSPLLSAINGRPNRSDD